MFPESTFHCWCFKLKDFISKSKSSTDSILYCLLSCLYSHVETIWTYLKIRKTVFSIDRAPCLIDFGLNLHLLNWFQTNPHFYLFLESLTFEYFRLSGVILYSMHTFFPTLIQNVSVRTCSENSSTELLIVLQAFPKPAKNRSADRTWVDW